MDGGNTERGLILREIETGLQTPISGVPASWGALAAPSPGGFLVAARKSGRQTPGDYALYSVRFDGSATLQGSFKPTPYGEEFTAAFLTSSGVLYVLTRCGGGTGECTIYRSTIEKIDIAYSEPELRKGKLPYLVPSSFFGE